MGFLQKLIPQRQPMDPGVEINEHASIGSVGSPDVTRYILETYDLVEDLEQKLRGNVFNERTRTWMSKGQPLMNNYGVNRIILLVSNFINRHIALSNFSEEDVRRIGLGVRIELIKVFRLEWHNFEVEKSMMSMIIRMIDASIYAMLRRAYHGGERESIGQRYKHIETPYSGVQRRNFGNVPSL